jgi:S1-C subfamily serine protease
MRPLDDINDLRTVLNATEPGSRIALTIWRAGAQRNVFVAPLPTKQQVETQ